MASLSPTQQEAILSELDQDWEAIARKNQHPPKGDWFVWLILAGRGWGKTRTGAEFIAESLKDNPGWRAALVAQTFDDGRDVMVEGESGLERVLTGRDIPYRWNRSLGQLLLPNGSRADIYSSERPKQLRGPQHHVGWGDEPAYWNDAPLGDAENTTWSNLKLGLRLGHDPRCVLTTTPKNYPLIKQLIEADGVTLTTGTTYENLANLSQTFRHNVLRKYEGTRLGRQELLAELLDEIEGALVSRAMFVHKQPPQILDAQHELVPNFHRGAVAIDPAVSYGPDSDETGIIAGGKAVDDNAYIVEDASGRYSPRQWARKAIAVAHAHGFDLIVGEVNNGGDMVEATLRAEGWQGAYHAVHATRGKRVRAEAVSGGYERNLELDAQGWRIYHARPFPMLEDQWCEFTPESSDSPDRVDAEVWLLTELMLEPSYSGPNFSMVA